MMLKLVAKFADRWNCPAGYESFEHKFNVLKNHCKDVGRDVNTIDISEQLLVCIGSERRGSRSEMEGGADAQAVRHAPESRARRNS